MSYILARNNIHQVPVGVRTSYSSEQHSKSSGSATYAARANCSFSDISSSLRLAVIFLSVQSTFTLTCSTGVPTTVETYTSPLIKFVHFQYTIKNCKSQVLFNILFYLQYLNGKNTNPTIKYNYATKNNTMFNNSFLIYIMRINRIF